MNIREVEQCTGIKAATIRYYEKEGLLKPGRNAGNNYREYTKKDLEILNRIKLLRQLDVPLGQIKDYQKEKLTLSEMMGKREEALEKEIRDMEKIKEQCRKLKMRDSTFETLEVPGLDLGSFSICRWEHEVERMKRIARLEGSEKLLRRSAAIMPSVYFLVRGISHLSGYQLPDGFSICYVLAVVAVLAIWAGLRKRIFAIRFKEEPS